MFGDDMEETVCAGWIWIGNGASVFGRLSLTVLPDIARELHVAPSECRQLQVQIAESPGQGTHGKEAADCARPAAPLPLPLPVGSVDRRRPTGKEKED